MEADKKVLADLVASVDASQRIALIMHVSPDGDTCGSAFALRRALVSYGKEVTLVCDHRVPHIYDDLDGADMVMKPDALAGEVFDLGFAIDVADRLRMGESAAVFDAARHTAQIDHHGTNPGYAEVNYVRSPLSATGVLAMEVIDALDVPLDRSMAKCLFVAITTDTGNFKKQNTDAAALRVSARCIAIGIDTASITRRVFDLRPYEQVKLLARALQSLTVFEDGQIGLMRLSLRDFEDTGALSEHTEGIIDFGINTEGVQIAALMSQKGEKIRCSLRSMPPYDVSRVASDLGGGGHTLAAGCTLEPPMAAASRRLRTALRKELHRHE
ncbi:bifunctional oligoribonuclease/PAP phosphatase NrnA [Eubacteriales bacterium OttesenSCG-928-A19]|nr:bifunctional oligoribonuclease/PAP phosphatase NrnA [Eubacteriales bacterium OttesenSCG-928-A19]